jgi:DNA-binding response OmpR family regulator
MEKSILVIDGTNQLGKIVEEAADGDSCFVAPDLAAADTFLEAVHFDWIALDLDVALTEGAAASWLGRLSRTRPQLAQRTLVIMGQPYQRALAESLEAFGASVLMKPLRADRLRIEMSDAAQGATAAARSTS